jgi:hypothetical protein
LLNKWSQSFQQPWLFHPPSLLKTLTAKVVVANKAEYLKNMDPNTHSNFPSDGQIYFQHLIAAYDYQEDVESLITPILENIEVLK